MKSEEGGHPDRGRSRPRPRDQAARAVAYLEFLLRVLRGPTSPPCNCDQAEKHTEFGHAL
jgi:hypothetical protein